MAPKEVPKTEAAYCLDLQKGDYAAPTFSKRHSQHITFTYSYPCLIFAEAAWSAPGPRHNTLYELWF